MLSIRTPALVLVTSLAVLAPIPAFAGTTQHQDATGDVVQADAASTSPDDTTPVPDRRSGDIRGFYATHGKRAVTASMGFVDLSRQEEMVTPVFRFRSDKGRRDVVLVTNTGRGTFSVMLRGNGKQVKCRIRTTVSFQTDKVRVRIPRKCFDNPRWVQAGGGIYEGNDQTVFLDDAYRNIGVGNDLRLGGPRLRR